MTTKAEAALNWILQSNSLQKKEKQEFINLVERILKNHGLGACGNNHLHGRRKLVSFLSDGERRKNG